MKDKPIKTRHIKIDPSKFITRSDISRYGGVENAIKARDGLLPQIEPPKPASSDIEWELDEDGHYFRRVKNADQ